MPPKPPKDKRVRGRGRRRNNKARTAASSPSEESSSERSSSSSSSDSNEGDPQHKSRENTSTKSKSRKDRKPRSPATTESLRKKRKIDTSAFQSPGGASLDTEFSSLDEVNDGPAAAAVPLEPISRASTEHQVNKKNEQPDDFESWYLRALTKQYANDLDKVRQAPDFKESSVPILVNALKQGAEIYGDRDREVVMRGGL